MKNTKPNSFNLEVVFVQDSKTKGWTAFFAQFPNIVAEGDNEHEATDNLIQLVKTVFEYQKKTMKLEDDIANSHLVKTKSFELAFSTY